MVHNKEDVHAVGFAGMGRNLRALWRDVMPDDADIAWLAPLEKRLAAVQVREEALSALRPRLMTPEMRTPVAHRLARQELVRPRLKRT